MILAALTVTLHAWVIPAVITAILMLLAFRVYLALNDPFMRYGYDREELFVVGFVMALCICCVWGVYFAWAYWHLSNLHP